MNVAGQDWRAQLLDRPIAALREIGSASVVALVSSTIALAIACAAFGIARRFGWI
jgi:hypothetical protein